jgi:hypothetical protein
MQEVKTHICCDVPLCDYEMTSHIHGRMRGGTAKQNGGLMFLGRNLQRNGRPAGQQDVARDKQGTAAAAFGMRVSVE